MDRYSFIVEDFHSVSLAGFSGAPRTLGCPFFVSPGRPQVTTHLWMVNEAFAGPELNIIAGPLDPASVFYLQLWTIELLTGCTDTYRKEARSRYEAMA